MDLLSLSPKHSLLLAVYGRSFLKEEQVQVLKLLQKGLKVLLFLDSPDEFEDLERFRGSSLLMIFHSKGLADPLIPMPYFLVDGQCSSRDLLILNKLAEMNPGFNLEQYRVEHASPEQHLSVEAGAGTGKTTVMVQRILFLLNVTSELSLKEIVMITFTKDAAKHMFRKLRKEFHSRFRLTRDHRYLTYIEELPFMQISTIHSFSKKLVQQLGSTHGFGTKVQIRSFGVERKRLIEEFLDEFLTEWMKHHPVSEKLRSLRLYELINKIVDFWGEMERKGLSQEEIERLEWGSVEGDSIGFQEMFLALFKECERRFQNLKEEENAISLNDLTRQIDMIARTSNDFRNVSNPIRFLFVDEFQDTDDSQIRLVAALQKAFNSALFVVGDIKQSIYRFRGANYTAFALLQEQLQEKSGQNMTSYPLVKNYRTSKVLLSQIDKLFSDWGEKEYLVYETPLVGMNNNDEYSLKIERVWYNKDDIKHKRHTIELIRRAIEDVRLENERLSEDQETKQAVVLVRTNREAQRVREWCEENNILYNLEIGGTFFTSEAVNDFASLVEALLYPTNPQSLLNLYASSYSEVQVDWKVLVPSNGDRERLLDLLGQNPPFIGWGEYVEKKIRLKPILSVLREIIDEINPVSNFHSRQMVSIRSANASADEADILNEASERTKQYQRNLNHLIEMIHDDFTNDFLTLYSLHKWLRLNQAINRDVDEPKLSSENRDGLIRIMTVHKSKGLEFHTVIIPFTERSFRWEGGDGFSELLFKREGELVTAGWLIKDDGLSWNNSHYLDIVEIEREEVIREEARLLYVAMTRCEKRLWILNNRIYERRDVVQNWSSLLPREGVIVE